jgi:hypothetical protein
VTRDGYTWDALVDEMMRDGTLRNINESIHIRRDASPLLTMRQAIETLAAYLRGASLAKN